MLHSLRCFSSPIKVPFLSHFFPAVPEEAWLVSICEAVIEENMLLGICF